MKQKFDISLKKNLQAVYLPSASKKTKKGPQSRKRGKSSHERKKRRHRRWIDTGERDVIIVREKEKEREGERREVELLIVCVMLVLISLMERKMGGDTMTWHCS